MRRSDAFHKLTEIIPNELFMKYSHLDLEQLVKIPDLQSYRDEINKVLDEWKASKDYAA
ncbi:MAG: hypothetical protein JXK94_13660 [Deltaproteobacteria bacterium]|nr:hypothetical protein [Deltaproteobacteria bacterium]